jgi:adenosylmethionine-8-amino-7-oxononanoate aminotransferase
VQRIIKSENLLNNVGRMGSLLSQLLTEQLSQHPNVGDVRGRGLFWGIEFVADKSTRQPFPAAANVAMGIAELGLGAPYGIAVYPGTGTVDGSNGDHVIVSPPYNVTEDVIRGIAAIIQRLVADYFVLKQVKDKVKQ